MRSTYDERNFVRAYELCSYLDGDPLDHLLDIHSVLVKDTLDQDFYGFRDVPAQLVEVAGNKVLKIIPVMNFLEEIDRISQEKRKFKGLDQVAFEHIELLKIHPFYDGNGRTGRILNILYLLKEGLLDSPILYLSSYIIRNKKEYYEFLNKVTKDNDWESWIIYMLKAIEFTSKETLRTAKEIKNLIDATIDFVKEKEPKIYSKELIEFIFKEVYLKANQLVDNGLSSRKTVVKYLKALEEIGVLQSEKVGREVIYINTALFNLLKNS